MNIKRVY